MIRFSYRRALVAALLTVVAGIGCQKKPDPAAAKAAAKPAPLTPEESFDIIVETFRRGIEDVPIGFDVQDNFGRRTMMTGKSVVTHTLVPPEKEGDPLKAEIKVVSDTQYSLQHSIETPDPQDADEAGESTTDGTATSGPDVQIFDPAVASEPGTAADRRGTPGKIDPNAVTVGQWPTSYERVYELVYENGRWKLLTKLDPNKEESIKVAFERALESQS
jgi:hypothetical protein